MAKCLYCGEHGPDRARYCLRCGQPLSDQPPRRWETLKTVTIVFADLIGSTPLAERLGPELFRDISRRYESIAREVLERFGAMVRFVGDGAMAVFGIPQLQEDDALRAVSAAIRLRNELAGLSEQLEATLGVQLHLRIGINTGEVVDDSLPVGDSVNTAARLEQSAGQDEILIADSTRQLVKGAVITEPIRARNLRGKGFPVEVWRVLDVEQGPMGAVPASAGPFVGREHELGMLRLAFDRVLAQHTCHLITVLGEPGIGKTRLASEFERRLHRRARVIRSRCKPRGDGTGAPPLTQLLEEAVGMGPDARAAIDGRLVEVPQVDRESMRRIEELLSPQPQRDVTPEGAAWAVRHLFHSLANRRPVVILIDDLEWADPTLLRLVEYVAETSREFPILILCLARLELMERRQDWGGGKPNSTILSLLPLTHEQSRELIEGLLHPAPAVDELMASLTEAAGGNPLHAEELVTLVNERRQSPTKADPAAVEFAELSTPPTIHVLLAARIDRLSPAEQLTIERAAIVGGEFRLTEVATLAAPVGRAEVVASLSSLVRKELLRSTGAAAAVDDQFFRFRHRLMHEAAYRRVAKQARADLHERYAEWLSRSGSPRADDAEALIGHHLEAAYRYSTELRQTERARTLARQAGERLAAAGRRVVGRDDAAAVPLLARAVALLSDNDAIRRDALLDQAAAAGGTGDATWAAQVYAEALEMARSAGDERRATHALLGQLEVQWFERLQDFLEPGREQIDAAIEVFEGMQDIGGQAKAWRLLAYIEAVVGRSRAAVRASQRAIESARRSGDELLEARSQRLHCFLLDWGPTPVDDVARYCEQVLAWARRQGMPSLESDSLHILARTTAMRGDFEEARKLLGTAKNISDRGEFLIWAGWRVSAAQVELLADQPDRAEQFIQPALDQLVSRGASGSQATVAALLARSLLLQDRDEEAEQAIRICRRTAADNQLDSQIKWREVGAVLAARRGELALAQRLAEEAATLADRYEQLDSQGQAYLDLALVYRVANRHKDAGLAARTARDLFERKGNLVSAAKARGILEKLASPLIRWPGELTGPDGEGQTRPV
jgi:class 3 adenylate cyclase